MTGGIYSESCEYSTGEGEGKEKKGPKSGGADSGGAGVAGERCVCVVVGAIRGSTERPMRAVFCFRSPELDQTTGKQSTHRSICGHCPPFSLTGTCSPAHPNSAEYIYYS